MKDECLHAQETLSQASDGVAVRAEDLRNAKVHCAACDECLAYVSALAALKKTPSPTAPPELADRVIAAVHAEAEQIDAEEAAATALLAAQADTMTGNMDAEEIDPAAMLAAEPRPSVGPDSWKGWAPYAAAAAVLLVVAGFAVMQGARFISGTGDTASSDVQPSQAGAPAPYDVESTAGEGTYSAADEQDGAENASYIEYGGWAYRFVRRTSSVSSPTAAGVVVSALDTEDAPTQHSVFTDSDSESLLLLDEDGRYLEFELVTRSAQGKSYVLVTRQIGGFGMWPLPPIGMPMPTEDDGSPVLRASVTDSHGQRMYVPDTDLPRDGFGVAPGTPRQDPAEGNPNWTWWQPVNRS